MNYTISCLINNLISILPHRRSFLSHVIITYLNVTSLILSDSQSTDRSSRRRRWSSSGTLLPYTIHSRACTSCPSFWVYTSIARGSSQQEDPEYLHPHCLRSSLQSPRVLSGPHVWGSITLHYSLSPLSSLQLCSLWESPAAPSHWPGKLACCGWVFEEACRPPICSQYRPVLSRSIVEIAKLGPANLQEVLPWWALPRPFLVVLIFW